MGFFILYQVYLREGPSLRGGVGGTGIRGLDACSESVGGGHGCSTWCHLGTMIFILMPAFHVLS